MYKSLTKFLTIALISFLSSNYAKAQFYNITIDLMSLSHNYDCCIDETGISCGFLPNNPEPKWFLWAGYSSGNYQAAPFFFGPNNQPCGTMTTFGSLTAPALIQSFNGVCTDRASMHVQSWEDDGCGSFLSYDVNCGTLQNDDNYADTYLDIPLTSPSPITVTITQTNGYTATVRVTYTQVGSAYPAPTANVTGGNNICSGSNAVINVTSALSVGTNSFVWFSDAALTTQIGTGTTFTTPNLTTTTTYYVAETNGNCKGTATPVTINVTTATAPTIGNQSICSGQTATLTATPPTGGSIQVYQNSNGTGLLGNVPYTTPALTTNTTYYVRTTLNNCQSSLVPVVITVSSALPTPTANDINSCTGQSITLTATGAGTINWYNVATGGSAIGTGSSFNVGVLAQGTHTYYASIGTPPCESLRDAAVVTINPTPGVPTFTAPTAICAGQTTTLTGSGSGTLNWYSDAALTNLVATGTSFTTPALNTNTGYYLVNNANNCNSASQTVNVPVTAIPAQPTVSTPAICNGQTATLTGTGTGTVAFYSDAAASNFLGNSPYTTPALTTTTDYYAVNIANNCSSASVTATVQVAPAIPMPVAADVNVCDGSSVTLTATSPATVNWYAAATGGTTLATGTSYNLGVLPAGNYSYFAEASVAICASSREEVLVTVTNSPTPTVSAGTSICNGSTTTITASGTGTINWYDDVALTNLVFTGANFTTPSLGTTTTYYAVNVVNNCPSTAASVTITVTSGVSVDAGLPTTICSNELAVLTATASGGTLPYTFDWDNGLGQGTTFNVIPQINTTYNVTLSDANGCTATDNITVTVNQAPTVVITPAGTLNLCGGTNATITASGAASYLWSIGETTAAILVGGIGTFTVTGTAANGCTASESVAVTSSPQINIAFNTPTPSLCSNANGTATATATGGSSTFSYLWDNGVTTANNNTLLSGSHTLSITDSFGCTATASINIPLISSIPASITTTQISCFNANDGVALASSTQGTQPFGFVWSNAATTGQVSGLAAGIYTVTITDANGCTGSAATSLTNPSALSVGISNSTDIVCFGDNNGTATVAVSGGTPTYNVIWSSGDASTTALNLAAGSYIVTATDSNGCSGTATVSIQEPTQITYSISTTDAGCFGESGGSIVLTASGGSNIFETSLDGVSYSNYMAYNGLTSDNYMVHIRDSYGCEIVESAFIDQHAQVDIVATTASETINLGDSTQLVATFVTPIIDPIISWTPSGSLSCDTCVNPVATPVTTTTYIVTVSDAYGCQDTAHVKVKVKTTRNVYIPTAFTPNNDGINEFFTVFGDNGVVMIENFMVFDRWGNKCFQANNIQPNAPELGWNGTLNGKVLNTGVYAYYVNIIFADGQSMDYKGDVTLVR